MDNFINVLQPMIIDKRILIVFAIALLIGIVVTIIKKAMKVAIVLVVIGFLFASFSPVINGVLAKLVERGLVAERGKADSPGRPTLYGTTDLFLKSIGISNISELPDLTDVENE